MIFKIVEDETTRFGVRIQNIFKDVKSDIRFTFGDDFVEELDKWDDVLQDLQQEMKLPDADYGVLKTQYLGAAPQEVKEFADNFDFLNGKVSDFSVHMKQSKLATEANGASFKQIKGLINTFNNSLASTGLTQEEFADGVAKGNNVLGNYLNRVGSGNAKLKGYIAELVATKVATIGLEVVTMALNAAITMGASALASWIVSGVITFIDNLIETEKELAERVQEANAAYKKHREELRNNEDAINDLMPEYERLSKGVDDLEQNVDLTDEQKEFSSRENSFSLSRYSLFIS